MARKNSSIELPRELVADLFETSQKFRQLLETLEVQLDPATLRRLKVGEKEYGMGRYKTASSTEDVNRVLNTFLKRFKKPPENVEVADGSGAAHLMSRLAPSVVHGWK